MQAGTVAVDIAIGAAGSEVVVVSDVPAETRIWLRVNRIVSCAMSASRIDLSDVAAFVDVGDQFVWFGVPSLLGIGSGTGSRNDPAGDQVHGVADPAAMRLTRASGPWVMW